MVVENVMQVTPSRARRRNFLQTRGKTDVRAQVGQKEKIRRIRSTGSARMRKGSVGIVWLRGTECERLGEEERERLVDLFM